MQAIILAAGMGKRLKDLTKDNTKCMVKVNGVSLIDRMLHQIEELDLSRIVIVTGYKGRELTDYINTLGIATPIVYIDNPIYDKTNNIYSLSLAEKELIEDDTLLFESDLIFDSSIIRELVDDPRDTLALVDKYESWMDGTCVTLDDDDSIISFVPGAKLDHANDNIYYKTVNIYKFSKEFSDKYYVPFLKAYRKALGENEYYEQVLRVITDLGREFIKAKRLSGQKWYEIDDVQDLDIAESIFTPDSDEKVRLMQSRYGGYWRYPKLLDFCYLVNPYYPPKRMLDEMRASFNTLITEYPSGMRVNSLLAAKNFGVKQEHIIIGNGAAELIKGFMERVAGRCGFIRPTFDEYPNRYEKADSVYYIPEERDFGYTADNIKDFFEDKDVGTIIIVNPDNPTGNYIPKSDLEELICWAADRNINILLDESFADFSDETDNTFIKEDILASHPNLYVMKSISKSYGVPGLRLGVLASSDEKRIAEMKKDAAIWNINSFAEFYMQIAEKYKKDYARALEKLRAERARFEEELSKVRGIRVVPSQANYVMVELNEGISPKELLKTLLVKYDILIKELTTKTNGRNYLRLAVRNTEDNDKLIAALKAELK